MTDWVEEVHDGWLRIGLKSTATLFDQASEFQHVKIVDTVGLGRALMLDDLWMTAERDEKTYHELLTHPPITTAAREVVDVLVIGGGDGGTIREVLRHDSVKRVVMVEVDGLVVEACKEHLPTIGGTAWDDPRLELIIGDGAAYVADVAPESFDVVLIDGADPVGPAAVLFGLSFFQNCRRALRPGGVLSTQGGSPLAQPHIHVDLIRTLRGAFDAVHPYYGSISIYPGGAWSWIWCGPEGVDPRQPNPARVEAIEPALQIYNREVHTGSFAVPTYVRRRLEG